MASRKAVMDAWNSVQDMDPFAQLMLRLQATARKLTSWSAKSIGNVRHNMALSRELLLRFDKAQEDRLLTVGEEWLCKKIKVTYLGLASLERTIARQRARIAVLKDGDANTSFHRQCTYRHQKNRIRSLAVGDRLLTDHGDMTEAVFLHYDSLLGTDTAHDHTLNLDQFIEPAGDLSDLDAPFGVEEIWGTVKRLPSRKAPGQMASQTNF
jgi:hypothetical protein